MAWIKPFSSTPPAVQSAVWSRGFIGVFEAKLSSSLILSDIDFYTVFDDVPCLGQEGFGRGFVDVLFATVVTDLSRDFFEDDG